METMSIGLPGNEHAMWNCAMSQTHNSLSGNAGQWEDLSGLSGQRPAASQMRGPGLLCSD